MRFLTVVLSVLAASGALSAQAPGVYTSAAPPAREALERLNLKTDWITYLPLDGRADGVALVQTVDTTQIFVQTKGGRVLAVDAITGAKQWTYRMPAHFVAAYPVGITDKFVFVVNVARLMCFHRYSGLVEFDFELPGSATSGPVADKELVFVILNGVRLNAYRYPSAVVVSERSRDRSAVPINAADTVAARYGNATNFSGLRDEAFTQRPTTIEPRTYMSVGPHQPTPSLSVLSSVLPPYVNSDRGFHPTPSVMVVSSLRQPYQYKPDYLQYNQRTPSISVLPPSVAAAAELANFRPRGIAPEPVWTYTATGRLRNEPILTDREPISIVKDGVPTSRVWMSTDGAVMEAVDKRTGKSQLIAPLQDRIAAPVVGPFPFGDKRLAIFGLVDGTIVAVETVKGGGFNIPRIEWRSNVGGYMNHRPIVTKDAVFVSGEQSGTARVELDGGDVTWKTESGADRVLAVNDEFVYVQDRRGRLALYDRRMPTDADTKRSYPLTTMDITGFGVMVSNDQSDRILLAADSGILVSLRDSAAKYLSPVPLIPPAPKADRKAEPKDVAAPDAAAPAAPPAPPAPEPKKKDGV